MPSKMIAARAIGNNTDIQPWILSSTIAVVVLAFFFVVLRFLARWTRSAPLGADDYLILCSMGMLLCVFGFVMAMTSFGMGLHADTLEAADIVMISKFLMIAEILYVINLALTKLSLLAMYYRIFPSRSFKLWAYGLGGFVIAWVITIIFVFIFICVPVQKMWYTDLPGHCVNQVGTWCANAASTIFSDVAILILPIPRVWKLNVGLIQRMSLIVVFGVGFFIVFTSIYRFTVLFSYSATDSSWTLSQTVVWTLIEISAGIISACLPTLRPVLGLILNQFNITMKSRDTKQAATGSKVTGGVGGTAIDASRGDGPFQRLDDSKLRPNHGGKITSTAVSRMATSENDNGSLSDDEIPLQKIHVRTEVDWVESK